MAYSLTHSFNNERVSTPNGSLGSLWDDANGPLRSSKDTAKAEQLIRFES